MLKIWHRHFYILLTASLVFLSSCALLSEDLKEAQAYVAQSNYEEAIRLLDGFKSGYSKKYNSEIHMDYAIKTLKNLDESKNTRYLKAKSLLEKSVNLDSKNHKARTYYVMLLKLMRNDNIEE